MSEKIVGYLLLIVGIAVMVFSAGSAYSVFTGKSQPIRLFATSGISIDFGQIVGGMLPPELAGQAGKKPAQKTEVIPGDVMNQLFNLLSYLMLMGFLMSFGYKLAELGVQLVRPVKVTLRGEGEKHE